MEDYEIITRLGGGSFSEVFKAKEKSTGEFVAIKVLKKKYTKWEDCLELRECKSLQKLNKASTISPGINHIIKLKQIIFIKESGTLNLVFEYCEKDLYELMKSNKKMSETQIRAIMHQTLLGLSYMHKYGFFHRDMKPENLLLLNEVIKIADFGLAREIRSVPPYTEYVSTRYYRAPECILKSTHYNSPIDIWAIGCIMAEMYLHPQPLFFGNNEKEVFYRMCSILGSPNHNNWNEGIQLAKMCNMKFPNFSSPTNLKNIIPQASDDAIDLMNKMLKWDPNDRMTANNLLKHPFFTNYVISQIVSTPDTGYSNVPIIGTGVKKYSNKRISKRTSINSSSNVNASKNSLSDFSKVFNDTKGFENLINNLKSEKNQIDKAFDEQIKKDDDDEGEIEFEESLLKSKTNFNVSERKKNEDDLKNNNNNKKESFKEIIKKKNNENSNENNNNNNSNNNNKLNNNSNAGFNGFYFGRKNNNIYFNNKNKENNLDFSSSNNNNNNLNNRRKLNDDYLNKNKIEENDNDDDDDLFSSKNKEITNKDNNIENNENDDEFYVINKKKTSELYSNNNINNKKILFGERRANILQKSSSTNKYEFSLPMNHNLNNDFGNLNNNNNNNNDFFSSFNKRNINRDNFNNNNNSINNNKIYENLPPRHHNLGNSYFSSSQKNINNNNNSSSNNNSNDNDVDYGNKLDFDTTKQLKNINKNPSRRSARKFLEETENKILENNNNLNFNFDNILSRRNNNNNNNINNNNNLFENRINNNIDMNIGNLAFGYRENKYNFSNNLNNNNNNLFGLPNINSYKFNINNDSGGNKFFSGNRRRYMNSNGNNYSNFDF